MINKSIYEEIFPDWGDTSVEEGWQSKIYISICKYTTLLEDLFYETLTAFWNGYSCQDDSTLKQCWFNVGPASETVAQQ